MCSYSKRINIFPPQQRYEPRLSFPGLQLHTQNDVRRLVQVVQREWTATSTNPSSFIMTQLLAEMQSPWYKKIYEEIIPENATVEEILTQAQKYLRKHAVRATTSDMHSIFGTINTQKLPREQQYFAQHALTVLEAGLHARQETSSLREAKRWVEQEKTTGIFTNHQNILLSDVQHFSIGKSRWRTSCLSDLMLSIIMLARSGKVNEKEIILLGGPDHYTMLVQGTWFINGKKQPVTKEEWQRKVAEQGMDPEEYFRKYECTPSVMIQLGAHMNVQGVEQIWEITTPDMYAICEDFFGFPFDPSKYYSSSQHQQRMQKREEDSQTSLEAIGAQVHQLVLQANYAARRADVELPEVYLAAAYENTHTREQAKAFSSIQEIVDYVSNIERSPAFGDKNRLALPGEVEHIQRASAYEAALMVATYHGLSHTFDGEKVNCLQFNETDAEIFIPGMYVCFEDDGAVMTHKIRA